MRIQVSRAPCPRRAPNSHHTDDAAADAATMDADDDADDDDAAAVVANHTLSHDARTEEENEQRNLSKEFIMSKMQQNQADQTSATAAPVTYYTRTPKAQHRTPTAGSASVRTPASGGGGPASAGGGIARTPHSRAPPSGVTAVASPSYTPKGHRSAVK